MCIDDYYASAELIYDESGLLIDFEYSIDQSAIKLVQLQRFCRQYDLSMKECIVVGDGDNDVDIFKATGRGIYIEADKSSEKLRKVAWKYATNLNEIIEIAQSL